MRAGWIRDRVRVIAHPNETISADAAAMRPRFGITGSRRKLDITTTYPELSRLHDRLVATEAEQSSASPDWILTAGEGRKLKILQPAVTLVNALEDEIAALDDEALAAKTPELKQRLENGEDLDDLIPEAFAVTREAAKRTLGERHFDVQLMGGAALHYG